MKTLVLDGDWELAFYPARELDIHHPSGLARSGVPTIPARVPGNVELDLFRADIIPDPFLADNIHLLRPLESHEWWYTREFDVPEDMYGRAWDIVFEGLDTLASVWINDVIAGNAANMLIPHRFDVTRLLRPGQKNRIHVRLQSPMQHARAQRYDASVCGPELREELLYLRKAPHMGGWDIMPRALSAGIWRSVWIEERPEAAIEDLYYWTIRADDSGAELGVRFQFRTPAAAVDNHRLRFEGSCDGHAFCHEWPVEFVAGGCRIPVPGARLWRPKGHGEPCLYTVTATLLHAGDVLAARTDRIGIRTLTLERTDKAGPRWMPGPKPGERCRYSEPWEPDHHFVFKVNGEPLMVKGSNWVPLDPFHSRDIGRVDEAVALADDLGCNMLRCWGGNVYESDRFFDLCDEKGILVWQDFAFACGRYPQTEPFLSEVRREAEAITARLRNHPCLAVWCGDNEVDAGYVWDGLDPAHNRINREVLPQVVHRCDPRRPYIASSPYIPPGSGEDTPEQHLWGPRGYYKSPFYTHHNAHFIGEIGYHGCPSVSSLRQFIPPGSEWPWRNNPVWRVHDTYHWRHAGVDRDRIKLMANQMRELFGTIPDTLELFALASQIVQAEAKKFFVESTRLRKWRTSGILWWNIIDGWPQFSDAIVDYYFGKKLAYHYLRRVQQPVCVIIGEPGTEKYHPVVVCNDTLRAVEVRYSVSDAGSGDVLAEGAITVPANENWQGTRLRGYAGEQRLYLVRWECDGAAHGNHYLAGQPAFSLEDYQRWLPAIAALPRAFDAEAVAT